MSFFSYSIYNHICFFLCSKKDIIKNHQKKNDIKILENLENQKLKKIWQNCINIWSILI